jgi:hypothetical protein
MFQSSILESLMRRLRTLVIGATALTLAACGGSGGDGAAVGPGASLAACDPSNAATAAACGTLLIGLTDAEGDIASYTLDVMSLSLQRADGSAIETLPAMTRIDFASLTELSELVGASLLPPGVFVGGTIRVDYSNAEIFVEAAGDIVAADITDSSGAPLGIVELNIELATDQPLLIRRGRSTFLSIDFDLAASHTINTGVSPPTVAAEPFITAEVLPVEEKEMRVRGALVSVDASASSYEIRLRPWFARAGDHGAVTVHTTATTHFEIGADVYTGAEGLSALSQLAAGTLTAAFGTLDVDDRSFTAQVVLARDSVSGDAIDVVHGNIVARSGDLLTVKGAHALYRSAPARFRRTIFVQVGPDTTVLKVSDRTGAYSEGDLSVGQRIAAFGAFTTGADPSSDAVPVLDASEGRVRMEPTHVIGQITAIDPGQVTMNLRAIDRLNADLFDFTGTGMSPALDADPAAYEIATASLPLTVLEVDRVARIVGFVNAFGAAPPDFTARTVIGYGDIPTALGIGWVAPGTTAPFTSMNADGLVLDLANPEISERHHMLIGRELVDLFDLAATPLIGPAAARTLFSLHEPGHVELFTNFTDFIDAMLVRLNNAGTVRSFAAYGRYDDGTNAVAANKIIIFTQPSD